MVDITKTQAEQSFFVYVKDKNTNKVKRIAIPNDVQIGLQGNPAELQLLGRLSLATVDYEVTAQNKGILYASSNDTVISITVVASPLSGRVTIYLPSNPRNGQLHFIKDKSGTADTVPIDVVPSGQTTIDEYEFMSITSKYGSIALYWFGDKWHVLISSSSGGGGGTSVDATYVTLSNDVTLINERRLNLSGTNLTMVDQGANSSVILDLSQILGGGAGTFSYATVTADAYGRITAISAGATSPSSWSDGGSKLFTTSSVSIDSQSRFADDIGSDVYFWVSGTIGSTSAQRVAAFGCDVRITGSLTVGTGSVSITGNDIQWSSNNTRIERSGNDMKFYDVNNPSGITLSQLLSSTSIVPISSTLAEFVPAQSGQTMLRWKFNTESLVGSNIYLNTGASGSINNALTASNPNNIRTGQSGVFGQAVGFSNAYFTSNDQKAIIAGNNLTVSMWLRPVTSGSGYKNIISKQYTSASWSSPYTPVSLYQVSSDNAIIEFGVTTTGGVRTTVNADSNTALKLRAEQWNHVALVYNGIFLRGYVNGTQVAAISKTGNLDWGTTPGGWTVGGNPVTLSEYYSGSIDDIRIEGNAWTPEQVQEHYQTGQFLTYVTGSKSLLASVNGNVVISSSFVAGTPTDFPGLVGWYEAQTGSITLDGTGVASVREWRDLSTASNHLGMVTKALQPPWCASNPDFGGISSIEFQAAHILSSSTNINLSTFTIVAVVIGKNNNGIFYEHSTNTNTASGGSYIYTGTGDSSYIKRGGSSTGKDNAFGGTWGTIYGPYPNIWAQHHGGSHLGHRMMIRNIDERYDTGTANADLGVTAFSDRIYIGARANAQPVVSPTLGLSGSIVAFAIYTPALRLDQVFKVMRYFGNKFNVGV